MILYTNQDNNFDIIKDKVDLSKSQFYNGGDDMDRFKESYDFLFNKLGSSEWIWCRGFAMFDGYTPKKMKIDGKLKQVRNWNYESYRLWMLEVPDKQIVCIDSDVWQYKISGWVYDKELWDYLDNLEITQRSAEKLLFEIEDFIKSKIDIDNTYKKLIKTSGWDINNDEFLIPSPVKKSWVKQTYQIIPENK